MDPEVLERIVNRITSVLLIGAFLFFAVHVREALPWVTGVVGVILGQLGGAALAQRVTKRTLKQAGISEAPPPAGRGP